MNHAGSLTVTKCLDIQNGNLVGSEVLRGLRADPE
jgi:hypothetical protein